MNSDDADCFPRRDGVYAVAAPPYPLNVQLGIGNMINPRAPDTYGDFVTHDHQYVSPQIPDPGRGEVTYGFHTATVVTGLEIVQHGNGITAIEGFVGDDPSTLTSIGRVFSARGDLSGGSQFSEFEPAVFLFTNRTPARVFRFVIRKTSLQDGYAFYRAFPLDLSGARILGAPEGELSVATAPSLLTENTGAASIQVERLRPVEQPASYGYAVTGGSAIPAMDFALAAGVLDFAAEVK
jgi:hypothetical protein